MFTFPIGHFSGKAKDASVEFIRTKINSTNQKSITDASVPIGDEYAERWVVFVLHAGSNGNVAGTNSCTIGGVAATKLLSRETGYGGCGMWIRKVPTGTTVTCVATTSGNMQYSGGSTYVIRDIKSETPVDSSITSTTASSSTINLNVSAGGIIIGDRGGWTNISSSFNWSGTSNLTEQYDANLSGSNDLRCSGATGSFITDDTNLSITSACTTSFISGANADFMAISMR